MKNSIFPVFMFLIFFEGFAQADPVPDFYGVLPAEVDGWKKAGPSEIYDNTTLFSYIDGGAELYLSYGFKKLTSLGYVRRKEEIRVDLFDMGSSYNAFGVFSHGRESMSAQLGQGSEYSSGFLNFWKGRFYVCLTGYPETDAKRRVLFKLGSAIERSIRGAGPLPPIVYALPPEGLIPESIRYARHYIWLNNHYFISHDNILLIGPQTDAVLARYNSPAGRLVLVLVNYADSQKAKTAEANFMKNYIPDSLSGIKRQKNGRFSGACRIGAGLALVFDAPDKHALEEMLARAVETRAPAAWRSHE